MRGRGGILTYGGVSLFVVAFAVFPIAAALFKEAQVPRRLIPAAIALGSFTFTMTALPGTPAIQNAIPIPFFGTDAFAAPGLGTIGGLVMFSGGMAWLTYRSKQAKANGEGYETARERAKVGAAQRADSSEGAPTGQAGTGQADADDGERRDSAVPVGAGGGPDPSADPNDRPDIPTPLAYLPILIVIGLNYAMVNWVFPALSFDYLAEDAYGATDIASVGGIWAIIVALIAAIVVLLATNWTRIGDTKKSVNEGTMGSLLPIFNTASEVGYGAVIASLPAFAVIRSAVLGVSDNPVVSLGLSVNVLAGITGSASGGMSIALEALGSTFNQLAIDQGISQELMHRVTAMASGGFDSLPHNGAVITLLAITGMSHRESYKDIGIVSVLIPLLALVTVVVLGTLFGGF